MLNVASPINPPILVRIKTDLKNAGTMHFMFGGRFEVSEKIWRMA
jgi:hypothetical protein